MLGHNSIRVVKHPALLISSLCRRPYHSPCLETCNMSEVAVAAPRRASNISSLRSASSPLFSNEGFQKHSLGRCVWFILSWRAKGVQRRRRRRGLGPGLQVWVATTRRLFLSRTERRVGEGLGPESRRYWHPTRPPWYICRCWSSAYFAHTLRFRGERARCQSAKGSARGRRGRYRHIRKRLQEDQRDASYGWREKLWGILHMMSAGAIS